MGEFDGYHCPKCDAELQGLGRGDRCPHCRHRLKRHEVYQQRRYPGTIVLSRAWLKWGLRLGALGVLGLMIAMLWLPTGAVGVDDARGWASMGGVAAMLLILAEFVEG